MTERFTVDDVIKAGGCPMGIRAWFRARGDQLPPGVNLKSFLAGGMSITEAHWCNDGFIERALRLKAQRKEG
jgi:hypothetical protein